MFSVCLLPVELILTSIETKAPTNNKRFEQQSDGTWRIWDLTDQKYSAATLNYKGQDQSYAYFKTTDGKEYRAHMYGGPIQLLSGTSWATLYQNTESK